MNSISTRARRALSAAVGLVLVAGGVVAMPSAAQADDVVPTPPAAEAPLPQPVSADALPTAQMNGVAWKQVIVGNTVYVGGNFTQARPAGSAPGTNTVARTHLMAYDITTGVMTSWAPVLNGQVKDLAASPDGKRLYATGSFTTVNGVNRYRVAAFDLPSGNLSSFAPGLNSAGQAIAATNTTVYLGGYFTNVNSSWRPRLAAVSAQTGAVLPFAPVIDDGTVSALVTAPDGQSVVAGGNFTSVAGSSTNGYGLGRFAADSGTVMALPVNSEVRNGGAESGITSLATDGTSFYGSGYHFGGGGNVEGSFSANWSDGSLRWLEDCHGDTYSVFPVGNVVYSASHKHYCGNSGGFPQASPKWDFYHSTATTNDVRGSNTRDIYGYPDHVGTPRPQFLTFFPRTDVGTFTGKSQAVWNVTGNDRYVAYGGEFPRVNGSAQQGLVRYATRSIAPNKQGPRNPGADLDPKAVSFSAGAARVSFTSTFDYDDSKLTYKLYRDSESSTPLFNDTIDTPFWKPVTKSITDAGMAAGSTHRYRLVVSDPYGNTTKTNWVSVTISDAALSPYVDSVLKDGASSLWRLGEADGSTGFDWAGASDLGLTGGFTRGADGAVPGNAATTFNGTDGTAGTQTPIPGPNVFSVEAWFKTTSTTGGKIIGFGDQKAGLSNNYDRHAYMDPQGRVTFGVYNGNTVTVTTPNALNDGQWHQVVGTMEATGVTLYVDGKRIGRNTGASSAQPYDGYWRVGGDRQWNGSEWFNGSIDDAAVYPNVLTLQQVQDHFQKSGRDLNLPTEPKDAYGKAVWASTPDLYWRLGESNGPTVQDSSVNDMPGTLTGGYGLGASGAVTGTANTAATFNGWDGGIFTNKLVANPTVYSEELWFKTTTNRGGKIIGFGCAQTGGSGCYDRHVWMKDDGTLTFGVWTGFENNISTSDRFNDGQWHHLVASQGPSGMALYVDGNLKGTNPQNTQQAYDGYWRVGGDTTWGGNSSNYFEGAIDEVAVYSSVLSDATVKAHFAAGGGQLPNQLPTAAFTPDVSGRDVVFDGSGSADPDGSIASYAWDFGDGVTSTEAKPTHRYTVSGKQTITLTVTDDRGGKATVTHDIDLNLAPQAKLTSQVSNLVVAFDGSGSSDTDGSVASYAWDFGDGQTSTEQKPSHTYPAAGSYDVTLVVKDDKGLASAAATGSVTVAPNKAPVAAFAASVDNLVAAFDGSGSSDTDGSVASYAWDFGDGQTSTEQKPTHTYAARGSYTVTLVVTDNQGLASAAVTKSISASPNAAPVASFSADVKNLVVGFDASASSDADGSVASYAWDFGDGETSTEQKPSHSYARSGSYTVTLTVKDDRGLTSTVTSKSVTVAANATPVASFTASPSNLVVAFDASASSDADGSVASYAWDFGDGDTATTVKPSHTYAAAGTYTVTLTVKDNQGLASDVVTKSVAVQGVTAWAQDGFGRTVASGWGTADTGGIWTLQGGNSYFAVNGGVGTLNIAQAGWSPKAQLQTVSRQDLEVKGSFSLDKIADGGGTYVSFTGRTGGFASEYRAKVWVKANGTVNLSTVALQSTETTVSSVNVAGLTVAAGDKLWVRFQMVGTGTTTLRAKIWKQGATEPTAWTTTGSNTTAQLQDAGGVGVSTSLSGSATTGASRVTVDDFWAGPLSGQQ
ncbi:PKD repeat protein [Terracoccus luteus]|uniref:PKD repeat protein n=1 Tax=Terracoccus luteus TaxID=53356 RepID=A0A495XV89_9MICO|nr:PKD domain-containing protein [Terracoccus luteus]RKT78480.1 PKD repeat protein [Terracoccus luteus]